MAINFLFCYKAYAKEFMLPGVWTRTEFLKTNGIWKANGSPIGQYCVPDHNQAPSQKQMLNTLDGMLSNGDGHLEGICKSEKYIQKKNQRSLIANCVQIASFTVIKKFHMSGLFLKVIKLNDRMIVVYTRSPKKLDSGHENFYSWNKKLVYKYHGPNCPKVDRKNVLNSHTSPNLLIGLPNGTYLN